MPQITIDECTDKLLDYYMISHPYLETKADALIEMLSHVFIGGQRATSRDIAYYQKRQSVGHLAKVIKSNYSNHQIRES